MAYRIETTADGFAAARVGGTVHMYVPGEGAGSIRTNYSEKEVSGMKASDFYGYSGDKVADLEAFKAYLDEHDWHHRQAAGLGRTRGPGGVRTPWGPSQGTEVYADGLIFHTTAGHGGFKVFAKLNREIPDVLRNSGGWYEEDVEFNKVVLSLPAYFTDLERKHAEEVIKNSYPDEWETLNGRELQPGESYRKDERAFKARHADDLVVIAASSYEEEGQKLVKCWATVGGERSGYSDGRAITAEESIWSVPAAEYQDRGPFGFVIDPDRHERLDVARAPSP